MKPLYLAPMEDVTDPAFRALCKSYGADRVYTEFVNADALVRDIASTTRKLTIHDSERPVAIQIYGREPEAMRDAALIVEQAKPDFIDINFGCPVKKVAGKGAGAGLLRDVPKMLEITRAVVNAVHTPVTAKTRLGWDENSLYLSDGTPFIVDLAERLQDCGITELAIHGRTRTPERARECFDRYGVDAIMVGRATFGAPWLFAEMKGLPAPRTMSEKVAVLKEHVLASIAWCGNDERKGIVHSRRHFAASPVFKGLDNFKQTRIALLRAETVEEVFAIMDEIVARYEKIL